MESTLDSPKALIVSPYLDHLGGGERYMLEITRVLQTDGWDVTVAWDDAEHVVLLAHALGIKLHKPKIDPRVQELYFTTNALKMLQSTRSYDLVVYLSDGSIPLLGGKKNMLHMQVPFHGVGGRSLANKIKLSRVGHVIVNSRFTKKVVDREYAINAKVIYPPVSPVNPGKKENIILSVGRFEPSLNVKRQDVLIDAFRALSPRVPDWQLALAGASANDAWLQALQKKAKGLPIKFFPNVSHTGLADLYAKASVYWHAAGFGIDEMKEPEKTEHFGISVVEAIAAGCIPLVVPKGGQKEIIPNDMFYWLTIEELVKKTQRILQNEKEYTKKLREISMKKFTNERFAKEVQVLIE